MAGICGQITLEPRPVDEAVLNGIVARMGHRGTRIQRLQRPAIWFASIDSERPLIWPPDGKELPSEFSVVMDGVIDNVRDLVRDLEREGHAVAADPAAVLAAGFRAHGIAFLSRVRGAFAAAIHDHDSETTWLVRDPLGTHPLYLHRTRSRVLFASELRPLLSDPAVRLDLDPAQLRVYLSLGFNPAPQTLLKGIHKMPPGNLLEVQRDGIKVVFYDRPPADAELDLDFATAVDSYRATLHRIVRRCDDGDPLGVLLSGGADSSTLLLLRTREGRPASTFTIGFSDAPAQEDERASAWNAARHLGSLHREKVIDTAEIGSLFGAVARVAEEPVAAGWMPPFLSLVESAVGQVPLLWSGQGTGPLHGEEPSWRWLQWGESMSELPNFVGKFVGGVARHLGGLGPGMEGSRILAVPEERERVLSSFFVFDDAALAQLLRAGHLGDPELARKQLERWREPVAGRDPLAQALYIRARTFLPEAVFAPATRMAAESRLAIRFPYADAELVHWLERLPASHRLEGGQGKRLHREALAEWVPGPVLSGPKRSLIDPVARWLRGPGKERASDWLLGPNAWMPSVLDGVRVRRVIEESCRGRASIVPLVLLLHLELWARETLLGGNR
jgi:asparagine synthase (glutamine-hydrolysing)